MIAIRFIAKYRSQAKITCLLRTYLFVLFFPRFLILFHFNTQVSLLTLFNERLWSMAYGVLLTTILMPHACVSSHCHYIYIHVYHVKTKRSYLIFYVLIQCTRS